MGGRSEMAKTTAHGRMTLLRLAAPVALVALVALAAGGCGGKGKPDASAPGPAAPTPAARTGATGATGDGTGGPGAARTGAAGAATAGQATLPHPAAKPSATAGKAVFRTHCLACHGEKGDGTGPAGAALNPKPRNFTDLAFMRKEKPGELFERLSEGMGAMPAWKDTLSETERWNALFYEWDFATSAEKVQQGRAVYARACASCHGADGKGDGPGGAALNPPPRDLTDAAWMTSHSKQDVVATLTDGKGGCPAQAGLGEADRWNVADYVWTFMYDSTHRGAAAH